jgi:putative membrane protein
MTRQNEAEPARPAPSEAMESERLEVERALMDADRVMLQIVQTSLSLIGIGVTIYTLFSNWAVRGVALADRMASRLGIALLVIGLLLLVGGIASQARYRFTLMRRAARAREAAGPDAWPTYRTAPTVGIASLLLLVGLVVFIAILGEMFFSSAGPP